MSSDRLASDDPTGGAALPLPGTESASTSASVSASASAPECWVFDVDGCLIDSLTGSSLRPGAGDLLEHLSKQGHRVILWSAGGAAYAAVRAREFGVDHLVEGFFAKEGRDAGGQTSGPEAVDELVGPAGQFGEGERDARRTGHHRRLIGVLLGEIPESEPPIPRVLHGE